MRVRCGRYVAALGLIGLLLSGAAPSERSKPGNPTVQGGENAPVGQPNTKDNQGTRQGLPAAPQPKPAPSAKRTDAVGGGDHEREASTWTDKVQAWSAGAVALFTLILTWVGFEQWRLLRRSSADSRDAIAIARQSAEAALLSAQVSEAALLNGPRPMLTLELTGWSDPIPDKPTDSHPVRLAVEARNVGERNAVVEAFWVELAAYTLGDQETFRSWPSPSLDRFENDLKSMAEDVLPNPVTLVPMATHSGEHTAYLSMAKDELAACWGTSRRRLLLFMLAVYRDPYGVTRQRGVTLAHSPLSKGDERWFRVLGGRFDFDEVTSLGNLDFANKRTPRPQPVG